MSVGLPRALLWYVGGAACRGDGTCSAQRGFSTGLPFASVACWWWSQRSGRPTCDGGASGGTWARRRRPC
eukprot:scaffold7993_cov239-Pinguiococcus_pyrenoidosus.AAC.3